MVVAQARAVPTYAERGDHPWERAVETTNELLAAVGDIKNTTRLETALEAFGQAVVAVSQPRSSMGARLRGRA
ncbi:hypothetical protein [Streptomyces albogriseolus]|uniref:hypothetical protein n=1 Tax=Streptomyces albogriseolus TaxID=1887 RepID=UPI0033AED635